MTYPQPPQPGYPAPPYDAPPQGYAPPPQQPYAPQNGYPVPGQPYAQPPQQQYPPQQGYQPQQPYSPQAPYGQPQPGYAPQDAAPASPPPTVAEFFEQPASGGGKPLSFNAVGTRYAGTVVRDVTDADMEHAREMGVRPGMQGNLALHPDGRKKVNMKVPLLLDQPTAEYPTGVAVWYVKNNERSELLRAMQVAGAEPGPPKGGDRVDITFTHEEQGRSGMAPRKVKHIVYTVGNGVLPQMPQAPAQAPQPQYQQGYQQYGQQPGFPAPAAAPPYAGSAPQTMQPALPNYNPQPAFAGQAPQVQYPQQQPQYAQPDPAQAYQQATGQQMPGYQQAPQQNWDPQAQAFPPGTFQQALPTPGAPGAPTGFTPGAPPTAPASPSSPGGPPPDWPADVPFIAGLKPEQARIAAMHHIGQPQ